MRKISRKLDRPRAKTFGPVVDLYEAEWRQKGKYEPPIHWVNLIVMIVALPVGFILTMVIGTPIHMAVSGWHWIFTGHLLP